MAITVGIILEMKAWKDCTIVAGNEGITNLVTSVDAMEIPDIAPWLRKGIMLITTGYAMKDEPLLLEQLIEDMHNVQGAAIAIKTRFIGTISENAISLANDFRIPLIIIEESIPHIDLRDPIVELLANENHKNLTLSIELHERFLELELKGSSFKEIAETLHELIDYHIFILDSHGKIIEQSIDNSLPADWEAELLTDDKAFIREGILPDKTTLVAQKDFTISGNTITCVMRIALKRGIICGYIVAVIINQPVDELSLMAIDYAAKTISLEFLRQEANAERLDQLDISLFLDIIGDTFNEGTAQRAKSLLWPSTPFLIAIFDIVNFSSIARSSNELELMTFKSEVKDALSTELSRKHLSHKIFNISDSFICLIFTENSYQELQVALQEIQKNLLTKGKKTALALSQMGKNIKDISTCYHDANDALYIRQQLNKDILFASIREYRLEQLLMSSIPSDALLQIYDDYFQAVIEYDKKNDANLLLTLKTFCTCCGSKKRAAQELFIHRNTLQYRLNKIESLLGISLSDERNIINLAILLSLEQLEGNGRI